MVDIQEALEATSKPAIDPKKKEEVEKTHFEVTTDYGAKVVIDVTPKPNKFAKQQQFFVHVLEDDGSEHEGNFIVRRLTVGEDARVGVVKASLAASLQVDDSTSSILHVIAKLSLCLLEKPDWFKPTEMYDYDIVLAVYGRVLAFEESFRKPVPEQGASAQT